jgi:thioesterase domain-containing protein/acyl carrier protein
VLAAIEPSLEALQAHARQKLPGYMVPTALVRLDALPLTSNGKVDRDALPPPDSAPSGCGASFVAPRDALELRLAKIWEAVLHVRPVGVRDSFFDLGGHSLLAVRLLVEIERVMHQQLPLATLFRAPTVEQLARMLRDEGWAAASGALVPIQPGGSRPPLFCLHPHEGHVLPYRSLARHLGSDQPLYGIEARHEEILSRPGLGIETLAARYIRDIRTLKAEGPYFLIGWCFGGVLAFETARQLEAAGQRVAFLGLLESQQPHGLRQSRFARGFRRVRHRVSFEMSNIFALAGRDRLEYLAGRCKRLAGAASRRFARLLGRESALDGAIRGVQERHLAAVRGYVPRVYSGTLHLFHPRNADPDLGWTGFAAGGIRVHDVPRVGHVDPNMFGESRVRVLADRLRACLDEAQTAVAAR